MTDDQHGEGTPRSGGRWDPLPQGDYDDGATAFVKLPEGGIDALLAASDSPLAARGHGYVPPQITPGAGTDQGAAGPWGAPADGSQWPDPNAAAPTEGDDRFTYNPASTQQWTYEDPQPTGHTPTSAPGHDVTGQWSIPVADGDLPDESGEFTTSSLVQQWGGTPPSTLPGGAAAPWATEAAGRPWDQPEAPGAEDGTGRPHESSTGTLPGRTHDARTGTGYDPQDGPAHEQSSPRTGVEPGASAPEPSGHAPVGADRPEYTSGPAHDREQPHGTPSPTAEYAGQPHPAGTPGHAPEHDGGADERPPGNAGHPDARAHGAGGDEHAHMAGDRTAHTADHTSGGSALAHLADPGEPYESAADAAVAASQAAQGAGEAAGVAEGTQGAAEAAEGAVEAAGAVDAVAGARDAGEAADAATADAPSDDPDATRAGPAPADRADQPDSAEEPSPLPPAEEHPLASYVLRVNGVERPVSDAWIGESLLYVLRERLGLAGAKDGCSQGECGACNVQVDGRLVASCLVPAVTASGSEVRTVEGLAEDGQPSDVQRALARCGAVQCGFCVPGMAMTVHDLLEGNPAPSELETRQALCGNLCRCSGYRGVVEAVKDVVAEREAHAAAEAAEHDGNEARIPHQAGPGAGGVNPSAFEAPGAMNPGPTGPRDQAYGQDGGQA
ncbi:2Fe-2S iron-sulfur cluster-binding protein [Streptomyces sp. NPDC006476]|uniref:2Fe-2S iron-sulfur cluster-binding protein n=1 Tax=Streptomyces sp. NPDC006476 TaxID=3157175 RepID=UPI0033BBD409